MNLENVGLLELAAKHLGGLLSEVAFVGGATVELWITDDAAPEFRPTDDVDVIVEITTPTSMRVSRGRCPLVPSHGSAPLR